MSAPQQPSFASPSLSYSGPTPTDPSSSPSTSTGRGPNGTTAPAPGPSFYQNGPNGSGYNGQSVPYGQYQSLPSQSQQFHQHQHQHQHQPYHHQPYYPRNTNSLGRPPYPPQPHQNKSFDQTQGQGQGYPRYPDQNQHQQFGYGWGGPGGGYYPGPGGYPPMGVPGPGPATMQNGYGYGQEGYGRQVGMGYGPGGQGQGQGYEQRNGESEISNSSAPSGETSSDSNQIHPQHLAYNPGPPEYPYQQNGPSGPGAPPYPYFPPNHPYNFGGGIGYPAYPPPPIGYGGYGFGDGYIPPPPAGAMGAGTTNGMNGGGGGGSSAPTKTLNPAAQGFNFVPPNQPPPPSSAPPLPISAPPPTTNEHPAPSSQPVFASIRRSPTPRLQPPVNGQPQQQQQQKFIPPVMVDGEKLKGIGGRRDPGDEYGGLPSVGGEGGLGLTNGDTQNGVVSQETSIRPDPASNQPSEISRLDEDVPGSTTTEIPVHTKTDPTDPSLPVQTPLSPPTPTVPETADATRPVQSTETPQPDSTSAAIPTSPTPLQTPSVHGDTYQFFGPTMSGYTSPSMSAQQPSLAQSMAQLVPTSSTTTSGSAPITTQAKKPKVNVDGPVVFASRPDQNESSGNIYSRSLRKAVPKGTKMEVRDSTVAKREKREDKARGPRKGKAIWGAGREIKQSSGRILGFGDVSTEEAESIRKQSPLPAPSTTITESTDVPPPSADTLASATTPSTASTPTPAPVPQPRAKPTSWAALVSSKPTSAAPSSLATSSIAPSTTATPSAGPSKLPSPTRSTSSLPPPPPTSSIPSESPQQPPVPAKKPAFNYAAAAATGAALSPADELVKILSEGLGNRVGSGARQGTIPRGLINTGNMCFINTILQTLAYCPPFTDLLETLGQRLKADLGRKTPLLEAMIIFLREFQPGAITLASSGSGTSTPQPQGLAGTRGISRVTSTASVQMGSNRNASGKEAFVPENVYDAMKENKRFDSMRRGFQEDAEEYLGFFLNTLHEELLHLLSRTHTRSPLPNGTNASSSAGREHSIERPVSPSEETSAEGWLEVGKKQRTHSVRSNTSRESAITRIFGGTLRSILHTPGSKDSITLEPYQPLQLDISSANSIVDALRHLSTPETVQTYSAAKKENVDATKTIYVETWPQVLMLHLKRFVYDAEEREVIKKGRAVGYGTELIMPNEIISPPKRSSTPVKYRLFGVVYHHGSTAGGGHYTVAVSRQDQNQWIHFDDELVQPVPTEQVVVSQEEVEMGRAGLIGGREKCAYLLFYQRVRA